MRWWSRCLVSGDDCRINRVIGVVDDVSLEIYAWMEWCYNSLFLQLSYWITRFGCHFGIIFKYFCEWEPPDILPNRRNRRLFYRKFYTRGRIPMLAMDQRHVVLSGFMLHSYASYLFSCTRQWDVYVSRCDLIFHTRMWSVHNFFRETIPPWPPSGYIASIGIFTAIIVFHSVVLFVSIFQIIAWNFRKFNLSLDHLSMRYMYQYVLRGIIRCIQDWKILRDQKSNITQSRLCDTFTFRFVCQRMTWIF